MHASNELRGDKDVVLAAVLAVESDEDDPALWHASTDMRSDKDVMLAAVKQDGELLRIASIDLRDDKDVVMAAIQQNREAEKYASDRLRYGAKKRRRVSTDAPRRSSRTTAAPERFYDGPMPTSRELAARARVLTCDR